MKYDVAIIGAGPGGSTAGRYLSKQGLKVLLIDKDNFPRDKPCGGGYSYSILERFPYLKKWESEFLEGICKVGVIHSPNRRITLKGEVDMAVSLRTNFDNALLEAALDSGADSLLGKRVKQVVIEEDGTTIMISDGSEVAARSIIGSDGVTSLVARQTGLHRRWESNQITACRVAEIPTNTQFIDELYTDEKEYQFFVNFGGEPGYGWIFPKATTLNIGLGIVGTHAAGLPRKFQTFIRFLQKNGRIPKSFDQSIVKGALVPTSGTIRKSYGRRVLLVGDSAGMVSPITGGGIDYAMRAGKIAALVLARSIENDLFDEATLSAYQRLWYSDFGNEIRPQLLAQRIFTSPLADTLFEIGRRDQTIQRIVTDAMSETTDSNPQILQLLFRTLLVCLRGAFHI